MHSKTKSFEPILKALANRRRLEILSHLKHKKEASVTQIAEHLKLSVKATSKHLSLLASVGILDKEQYSKFVLASLSPNPPEVAKRILALL